MTDHAEENHSAETALSEEAQNLKSKMMPLMVTILTAEHEIRGVIYVSRESRNERRLTELLNEGGRRFLAIKDVEVINREQPSGARMYPFMEIHINNILMIHPSAQAIAKHTSYSKEEALRLDQFREKHYRKAHF